MFILLLLSGVTNPSLLAGVCAACMLAYIFLQMKWWAADTVVAIPSQKALLMCPYVSSGKFCVLAPRCSRALLHNLQPTSDRCLIFASHLATGMIPAIVIISCLLCLQGTRYRCLCVQSSMSSSLHHLAYRRLSVLICLQAPVSFSSCFGTSFSAAPLRIASLTLLSNVE